MNIVRVIPGVWSILTHPFERGRVIGSGKLAEVVGA